MPESHQRNGLPSTIDVRTSVRRNPAGEELPAFGRVVHAIWPSKPALNLAQRIGCSERAAQLYVRGERDPSLGAILVIIEAIRGRRRA